METLWRRLYRVVIAGGVVFLLFSIVLVVGINRGHVTQSNGFTTNTPEAAAATLSGSLPQAAANVRYCRATVGMGGRLLIYRFSAPVADLHTHAQAEFAAHWHQPPLKKTLAATTPFTEQETSHWRSGFGVDAHWMLPPPGALGTIYESADGQSSHRPTIFVDESNGVLYFQMSD